MQSYNRRYLAIITVGSCASPTYNIFGSFNNVVKIFKGVFFPLEFSKVRLCSFLVLLRAKSRERDHFKQACRVWHH